MYESMYGMAERARFELANPFELAVFKLSASKRGRSSSLTVGQGDRPRLTPDSMYKSMYAR